MNIKVKRVYEEPNAQDGRRILVDRLWPRGVSKNKAEIDQWLKDIAPSIALRQWYRHAPEKWEPFKQQYFAELDIKTALLEEIVSAARKNRITFLYGAKEQKLNNAHALKAYIELKY